VPDTAKPTRFRVTLSKQRQKFSAAHFTLFPDGDVERLHGHDYRVVVTLTANELKRGMLFPFHQIKPVIDGVCARLDEMMLLPGESDWVRIRSEGADTNVLVQTPVVDKRYRFPTDEVVCLPCDNVTCENLSRILLQNLLTELAPMNLSIDQLEVEISESSGQRVRAIHDHPLEP